MWSVRLVRLDSMHKYSWDCLRSVWFWFLSKCKSLWDDCGIRRKTNFSRRLHERRCCFGEFLPVVQQELQHSQECRWKHTSHTFGLTLARGSIYPVTESICSSLCGDLWGFGSMLSPQLSQSHPRALTDLLSHPSEPRHCLLAFTFMPLDTCIIIRTLGQIKELTVIIM